MASATSNFGTAGQDADGDLTWSDPSAALVQNAAGSCVSVSAAAISNTLKLSGVSFGVPAAAAITGIKVRTRATTIAIAGAIFLSNLRLYDSDGLNSDQLASNNVYDDDGYSGIDYGGDGDLHAPTREWTPDTIETLEVRMQFQATGAPAAGAACVDYVGMTVYYSLPGADTVFSKTTMIPVCKTGVNVGVPSGIAN